MIPSIAVPQTPRFTDKQGQYLAFIYNYTVLNGRPPAEADMESFFCVTAPSVHQMVLALERAELIRRTPRQARSIELAVDAAEIPQLQPIKITVAGY
jgi:SOS-response transcriptional repressor LexA